MSNLFQYTKTEGQGWLVEKPEMEKPDESTPPFFSDWEDYSNHIATLRRFKYDYPDPGKEMELGKDFEMVINPNGAQHHFAPNIAIPITQRTYSEQDLLDTWDAAGYSLEPSLSKQQFFKQKFGIEIK